MKDWKMWVMVVGVLLLVGCANNATSKQGLFSPAESGADFKANSRNVINIYNAGPTSRPADGVAVGTGEGDDKEYLADHTATWAEGQMKFPRGANNQYVSIEIGTDTASRADQRSRSAASGTTDQEVTQETRAGISFMLQAMASLFGQQGGTPAATGQGDASSGSLEQKLDAVLEDIALLKKERASAETRPSG